MAMGLTENAEKTIKFHWLISSFFPLNDRKLGYSALFVIKYIIVSCGPQLYSHRQDVELDYWHCLMCIYLYVYISTYIYNYNELSKEV